MWSVCFWAGIRFRIFVSGIEMLCPSTFEKCCSTGEHFPALTLRPRAVEAVVNGHTKGGLNYTTAIHKLLTLELLQRLFFDAN